MASSLRKNGSRRRLAAITFLSNISLDGSYRDTKLSLLPRGGVIISGLKKDVVDTFQEESDDCFSDTDHVFFNNTNCKQRKPQVFATHTMDKYSLSSESECVFTPIRSGLDESNLIKGIVGPYRERTLTSVSESNVGGHHHKRMLTQGSINSECERLCGSSSESIGPINATRSKISPAPPSAILEVNGEKEIKVLKPTANTKFRGERLVMVTDRHNPFIVCSVIPFTRTHKSRFDIRKEATRKRHISGSRPLSSSTGDGFDPFEMLGIEREVDGQEISYGKLLVPTHSVKEFRERRHLTYDEAIELAPAACRKRHIVARTKVLTCQPGYKWCFSYDQGSQRATAHMVATSPPPDSKEDANPKLLIYTPNLLDDPELIAGKHRTLLTFTSYMTSVIDYVRQSDLKKETNDKFRDRFPHIQLTLSKLRSLKREMRKIGKAEYGIDLVTVAQAYVYFEKLILRGLINKQNRKLCAAASLLLSAKLNDIKGDTLKALVERIENVFRLNRKDLFASEFAVLVALEFGLHIATWEVFPHYQRLLYES